MQFDNPLISFRDREEEPIIPRKLQALDSDFKFFPSVSNLLDMLQKVGFMNIRWYPDRKNQCDVGLYDICQKIILCPKRINSVRIYRRVKDE